MDCCIEGDEPADEQNQCADIESVLRRLNHEIRHTVGSDTKTVTVHRDDLIEAIRAIDILRAEIKEMSDYVRELTELGEKNELVRLRDENNELREYRKRYLELLDSDKK